MNNYLLGWLLLASEPALAQTTYPFLVKGKVGTLNAPAKIYLLRFSQPLDSATLKDGRFELKGRVDFFGSADLVVERGGKLRDNFSRQAHFVSPDRITIFLEPPRAKSSRSTCTATPWKPPWRGTSSKLAPKPGGQSIRWLPAASFPHPGRGPVLTRAEEERQQVVD